MKHIYPKLKGNFLEIIDQENCYINSIYGQSEIFKEMDTFELTGNVVKKKNTRITWVEGVIDDSGNKYWIPLQVNPIFGPNHRVINPRNEELGPEAYCSY
jgi:hypothetical protein